MIIPAHARNRRIFAAAGSGVFQRVVQVASTFIIMPIVLHALGPARFGVWGAAVSLAWISGLADIGTGSALVTLVARSLARNRPDEARSHVTGALIIGSCLSCLMLSVVSIAWITGAFQSNSQGYLVALSGLAINIPLSSANNLWMGMQKGYTSGFWELVQTVLTTASLAVATISTQDLRIYVALVFGCLVLANLGSLIHLFWLHPELRPGSSPTPLASIREVAGSGILFFVLGITGGASFMFDNVLALQLLGPEASARMTIALRICMTAVGFLIVLSQPLWPAFTDAAHKADRKWIRRTLLRGSSVLVGATIAGSAVLVLYGEPLLRLWLRENLGISRSLLWAISAWVLAQALLRVPALLLNALALIRFQIIVSAAVTVIAVAGKFALASSLGVAGILTATTIAVVLIAVPACVWRIYRWADHSARQEIMAHNE